MAAAADHRFAANRRMWDQMAEVHAGKESAYRIGEVIARRGRWWAQLPDPVGPVKGTSVLHLQCHIGTDTLWWASRGARVTGLDFSRRSILEARQLSVASGLRARFVEGNVYDAARIFRERFDFVVTYGGVTNWLPDLPRWGRVIAQLLRSGGTFYLKELHPFLYTFELKRGAWRASPGGSWFARGAVRDPGGTTGGTYAAPDAKIRWGASYEWQHGIGEVVSALAGAGLRIEYVHEFPFLFSDVGGVFGRMIRDRRGRWSFPGWKGKVPLQFSVLARRP